MPRKAKARDTWGAAPSPFKVYRDKRGRFIPATKKRGAKVATIYTMRGEGGRFVSPIRVFLRQTQAMTEAEIERVANYKPLAKRLRIAWDRFDIGRTVTPGHRKIIYRGRSYYKKGWRALRDKRIREIKLDYYMEVLGVSKRDAVKLLNYILSGGQGDVILNEMRRRVGSPARKKRS